MEHHLQRRGYGGDHRRGDHGRDPRCSERHRRHSREARPATATMLLFVNGARPPAAQGSRGDQTPQSRVQGGDRHESQEEHFRDEEEDVAGADGAICEGFYKPSHLSPSCASQLSTLFFSCAPACVGLSERGPLFPASPAPRSRGALLPARGIAKGALRIWARIGGEGGLAPAKGLLCVAANRSLEEMEHDETGCQAPEGPILCINNCGFFGSAATMNMCSKCHKELVLKQEQAKLSSSSIDSIINGCGSSSGGKAFVITGNVDGADPLVEPKTIATRSGDPLISRECSQKKVKEGPNRCTTCRKHVGLTGFNCRCGNLFCAIHRYSDKHNCTFDYQTAARDAIAKANPVVKAKKLDKI